MVVVCSIGISHYNNSDDIPCAVADAEQVYCAFQKVLSGVFNPNRSMCLYDISNHQFETIIEAIKISLTSEDIFVLYFSGHGEVRSSTNLNLLFKDGSCSTTRISDIFAGCNLKVVLILDCCQAGGATTFASSVNEQQLSVLASCGNFETSEYSSTGSEFTNYLCRSLYSLSAEGECISLSSVAKKIIQLGYSKAIVNIGASPNGDCIFIEKNLILETYTDFAERFLQQLKGANSLLREALWYSLADIPDSVIKRICKEYFRCFNNNTEFYPEASWLIRRAIGSIIAQLDDSKEIIVTLLKSLFWQEQCIGIIGARYLLQTDDELYGILSEQIKQKKIKELDPLWLCNLYMSDNKKYDYHLFLDTALGETAWGTIEIFKTTKNIGIEDYKSSLKNSNVPQDIIDKIDFYVSFKNDASSGGLFSILVMQASRGRLPPKVKSKFLLSALYGTWRGYIKLNLMNYLETTKTTRISEELKEASTIQDIDYKVAIFVYFAHNSEQMTKYSKDLEWGLWDEHPRVRTFAIKAFKMISYSDNLIYQSIIRNCTNTNLPGIFDLFLECPHTYRDALVALLMDSNEFNLGDINSLIYSWKNN